MAAASRSRSRPRYQTIWQEPQVNVRGTTTYEPAADRLAFRQLQVQSTTLAVMADGQIDRLSTTADVNANGALNYDLAQITPLLEAVGRRRDSTRRQRNGAVPGGGQPHADPSRRHWSQTLAGPRRVAVDESANVYGLPIGPGKLAAALGGGLGPRRSAGDRRGRRATDDRAAGAARSGTDGADAAARAGAHERPHLARRSARRCSSTSRRCSPARRRAKASSR